MIDSRIRSYLEECNSPQGFQILCSVSNGFAGFGSSVVTALQDEYPKKAKLIFGITPPTQVIKAQMNENMALVMESFTDSGAFYVPLRPPSLSDFASERALSKYLRPVRNFKPGIFFPLLINSPCIGRCRQHMNGLAI